MLNEELKTVLLHNYRNRINKDDDFDINSELEKLLNDIGYSTADAGGQVTFYGKDPIQPSTLRIASLAGIGLAAKSVALASLWQKRGGNGQDIYVLSLIHISEPTRPTSRRQRQMCIRDRLNPYPSSHRHTLELIKALPNKQSVAHAIKQWSAKDLEEAAAEKGVVMPMVRTLPEFMEEEQFEYIAKEPLVTIEKIGESEPEGFSENPQQPLDGIRALGMGHVIAGAGLGRGLALHGADVLNVWRPSELEEETLLLTSHIGMRSTYLDIDHSTEHQQKFDDLLKSADIFFMNKRYGFMQERHLTPHELAEKRPGIIHCSVNCYGDQGPWSDRNGFDQTAGSAAGVMALEGTEDQPKLPPIVVVNDYVISWLLETGAIKALERRAKEGGSYRVQVNLSRVSLYLMSLGIFEKAYVNEVFNTTDTHAIVAPDQFESETPLGHYIGVTDQVIMSETPGHYRTTLIPRGSSKPEWLSYRKI
ncbi:CoA transferase [Staphylococcus xylosus]|uniref:CoA transferase n=1 Tax=Staphylococcus xylosus TaxID=1288 RepID=UPI001C59DCDD|nr:CoA transferase [Staphylococcus xylosus]MBW3126679.1 CoA transferase [Staphylococcus xylosus]